MWWAGPQSDMISAPQPTTRASVRLVCTLSSPLTGAVLTVEWYGPVWVTCTLPGLWCCFCGIWHISRGGSTRCIGPGGGGLACFALGGPLREGPCSTGREAGRPIGGMDPQKHSTGCLHGASKFHDGNCFPLGFWLGDGQGRWCFPAPLFPSPAELYLPGLNNSPSHCLPLSEQSC